MLAEMLVRLLGVRTVGLLVEQLVARKVASMVDLLVVSTADQSVLKTVAT